MLMLTVPTSLDHLLAHVMQAIPAMEYRVLMTISAKTTLKIVTVRLLAPILLVPSHAPVILVTVVAVLHVLIMTNVQTILTLVTQMHRAPILSEVTLVLFTLVGKAMVKHVLTLINVLSPPFAIHLTTVTSMPVVLTQMVHSNAAVMLVGLETASLVPTSTNVLMMQTTIAIPMQAVLIMTDLTYVPVT